MWQVIIIFRGCFTAALTKLPPASTGGGDTHLHDKTWNLCRHRHRVFVNIRKQPLTASSLFTSRTTPPTQHHPPSPHITLVPFGVRARGFWCMRGAFLKPPPIDPYTRNLIRSDDFSILISLCRRSETYSRNRFVQNPQPLIMESTIMFFVYDDILFQLKKKIRQMLGVPPSFPTNGFSPVKKTVFLSSGFILVISKIYFSSFCIKNTYAKQLVRVLPIVNDVNIFFRFPGTRLCYYNLYGPKKI
ncbi:hypothetical protein QTP88_012721 [Uroleucon formosanum]